jgi:hypothetical protein
LLEGRHHAFARAVSAELPDRLEHGQVGFAPAVLLDTLPTPHEHAVPIRQWLDKRINERRLADAGLACHEDDLALPVERSVEATF